MLGWVLVGVWTGFPRWWETVLYSSATSVTVVMVFAIQHTQHREQMVIQRKLDELLRALPEADDQLIAVEGASDDELDALAGLNSADRRHAAAPSSENGEPDPTMSEPSVACDTRLDVQCRTIEPDGSDR